MTLRVQQGMVLAMALIMLALLSVLAGISIRGASSAEQFASQDRLKALARQTAEAALRFCEQQVQANAADPGLGFAPEDEPAGAAARYTWELMDRWDKEPSSQLRKVSLKAAGDTEAAAYFTRPAECMSQYLDPAHKVVVTTARGFGPEVPAQKDQDNNPPQGTEIWLQSFVTLE